MHEALENADVAFNLSKTGGMIFNISRGGADTLWQ
jgi:hypothetical protein